MPFAEDTSKNLYTTTLGNTPKGEANALVKVGGESVTKFVPNINMTKWGNDAWLNINYPDIITTEKQVYYKKTGVIQLECGDTSHQFYIKPDGTFEWEIWMAKQPAKSELLFNIQYSAGLKFYEQLPLSELPPDPTGMVSTRPVEVEYSYAVYLDETYPRMGQYQTGKLCHIYRPCLVDFNGDTSWGKVKIDETAKTMTLVFDEKWLSTAVYPVHSKGTHLGYESVGETSAAWSSLYTIFAYIGSAASSGTSDSLVMYSSHAASTLDIAVGMYNSSAGGGDVDNLISGSPVVTNNVSAWSLGWKAMPMGSLSVTSGTKYFLAGSVSEQMDAIYYDSVGEDYEGYKATNYITTFPDPGSPDGYLTRTFSWYLDYTPAGGLPIPVAMHHYLHNMGRK